MANIKRVAITGWLPFDCYRDGEFAHWLAFMAGPTAGIKIVWEGPVRFKPNEHGGQTTFYQFTIQGEEALRWLALDNIRDIIERLGTLDTWDTIDIEDV